MRTHPTHIRTAFSRSECSARRAGILLALAIVLIVLATAALALLVLAPRKSTPPAPTLPDLSEFEPRVAEAIQQRHNEVVADPGNAHNWGLLGAVYHAHDLYEIASECYDHAWDLDPGEHRWPYLRALCLELTGGEIDLIVQLFREVIEHDPDYAPAHVNLGAALSRAGQPDEAIASLERALTLEPGWAMTHRLLGQAYLKIGRTDDALTHLTTANEQAPGDRGTLSALAQASHLAGDAAAARSFMEQSAGAEDVITLPDSVLHFVQSLGVSARKCDDRARTLMADSEYENALKNLMIVLESRPNDGRIHARIGEAYARLDNDEEAQRHWKRALELTPEQPAVYRNLALASSRAGEHLSAVEYLARGFAYANDDETYLMQLISAYERINATAEPVAVLTEYLGRHPEAIQPRLRMADLLLKQNRTNDAIAQLRTLIEQNPNEPDAHFGLGVIYEQTGQREQAIEAYRAAVRIDPSHRARERLRALGAGG